jgi:hypothetical protein
MNSTNPPAAGATLARISIACGLLSPFTFGLGSLLGMVLGGAAIVRNRKAGADKRIEKLAVTGILTSIICLPLSLLITFRILTRQHG